MRSLFPLTKRNKIIVVIVLCVLGSSILGGIAGFVEQRISQRNSPPLKIYMVTYSVSGTNTSMAVNFIIQKNGSPEMSIARITPPWSINFTAASRDLVYLAAQLDSRSGTVNLSIDINGSRLKTKSCSGTFSECSVSSNLPW